MKIKLKNTSVGTSIIEEAPPAVPAVYTLSLKYSSDNTIQNL